MEWVNRVLTERTKFSLRKGIADRESIKELYSRYVELRIWRIKSRKSGTGLFGVLGCRSEAN